MSIVNIMAGRLTGDPECKATQSGTTMTNFSLADNQGKDKDGKEKVTFFRCTAFGKQGEMILASCKKGHRLNIVGRLETREYTDNSGQHRVSMDVTVHDFGFIEPRQDQSPAPAPQQTAPAGYTPPPGYGQQPAAPQAPPQQQPQYTRDAAGNIYQMINGQWVIVPPAQTSRPQQRPPAPAPQQPQQQPHQGFGQPFNPNDVPF